MPRFRPDLGSLRLFRLFVTSYEVGLRLVKGGSQRIWPQRWKRGGKKVVSYALNSPTVQNVYQPGWAISRKCPDDARAWNNMYDALFARVCAPRPSWKVIKDETVGARASKIFVTRKSLDPWDTRIPTPARTTVDDEVDPGGSGASCHGPNRSQL